MVSISIQIIVYCFTHRSVNIGYATKWPLVNLQFYSLHIAVYTSFLNGTCIQNLIFLLAYNFK